MLRKGWDDCKDVGDWYFFKDDRYITIRFGEAWDEAVSLPIATAENKVSPSEWIWDGNKESPTLTPSILVRGRPGEPDKWHGFLRAGKLVLA